MNYVSLAAVVPMLLVVLPVHASSSVKCRFEALVQNVEPRTAADHPDAVDLRVSIVEPAERERGTRYCRGKVGRQLFDPGAQLHVVLTPLDAESIRPGSRGRFIYHYLDSMTPSGFVFDEWFELEGMTSSE